jgi:hypothetical protein
MDEQKKEKKVIEISIGDIMAIAAIIISVISIIKSEITIQSLKMLH